MLLRNVLHFFEEFADGSRCFVTLRAENQGSHVYPAFSLDVEPAETTTVLINGSPRCELANDTDDLILPSLKPIQSCFGSLAKHSITIMKVTENKTIRYQYKSFDVESVFRC